MMPMDVTMHEIAYRDGDLDLLGFVAASEGATARPGILLVPAVFGMTDHPRDKARSLSELGYTVFVADMHGGGASFGSLAEAMPRGNALAADPAVWLGRLNAALATLRAQPGVDGDKIAAIGFCFGGTGVLELAFSGAELKAAVSFHGGLKLSDPSGAARAKASILICTGAEDPLVPESDVAALQAHLREARADWTVQTLGGALHAFTDPAADHFGTPVAGYSPTADRRSWNAMKELLAERFA